MIIFPFSFKIYTKRLNLIQRNWRREKKLTWFFLSDKLMAWMLNNAFNANQTNACDAKMSHELFWVLRAEIWTFHHLLMLISKFKSKIILWQLFRFKRFLKTSLAQRAKCKSLLFYLDEADFAESMTTTEISRYPCLPVKVIITWRAFHLYFK